MTIQPRSKKRQSLQTTTGEPYEVKTELWPDGQLLIHTTDGFMVCLSDKQRREFIRGISL